MALSSTAADDIKLAFEGVRHHYVAAATNEYLTNNRFFGAYSRRHWHFAIHRHITPAQNDLTFGTNGAFDFFLTSQAGSRLLWQKEHADAIIARLRQGYILFRHFLAEIGIGYLNQDTCTVTHQRVSANGATVVQIFQNLQTLLNDRVAFLPLDVCDKTDTTGIVFVGWVVKSLPFRYSRIHHARILQKLKRRNSKNPVRQNQAGDQVAPPPSLVTVSATSYGNSLNMPSNNIAGPGAPSTRVDAFIRPPGCLSLVSLFHLYCAQLNALFVWACMSGCQPNRAELNPLVCRFVRFADAIDMAQPKHAKSAILY
jgi:hypothetical protein